MHYLSLRLRIIISLIIIYVLTGCGSPQIVEDTAKLDQAYIPLLFMTGQPQTTRDQAIKRFDHFVRRWRLYYGHYEAANQINPNWAKGLDKVNHTVRMVEDSLLDSGQLSQIHVMLESIRIDLMKLRQQNQIFYAPDELTAFHELMEPMWEAGVKMTTDSTKAEQYVGPILNKLEAAEKQWLRVRMVKFDPELFDFDSTKADQLKNGIAGIQHTLDQLDSAVDQHDTEKIAQLAKSLKPAFVKIYLLFGDFSQPNNI